MPFYLKCPHCQHPQVVPHARRGRTRFCRQCGRAFITSKVVDIAYPLPITSMAELHSKASPARKGLVLVA